MNSAQLIYRGKLRLSFDIPFLDTPFYLYASHLYTSTLFYVFSCGSARASSLPMSLPVSLPVSP